MNLPEIAKIAAKFVAPRATSSIRDLGARTGKSVTVEGWLHRKSKQLGKALTLAQLRDADGSTIQLIDSRPHSPLRKLKPDSVLTVEGRIADGEIQVEDVHVLNEANLIPGQLLAEKTQSWPAEFRYIQLRQPENHELLVKRSLIVRTCRRTLEDKHNFVEIETPLLFKSTPEGAREFLVPTRRRDRFYALPQSPQQYKQLLIASGVSRYFQVARCFRDEDLRQDRQPEFTQLDLEMAFAGPHEVQQVIESVVCQAWKYHGPQLRTFEAAIPAPIEDDGKFSHMSYDECIAGYGIDKPDLRFPLRIRTLPAVPRARLEYSVLEALVLPPQTEVEEVERISVHVYEDEAQLKTVVDSIATYDNWDEVFSAINPQAGDVIVLGDRQARSYENPTPLGRVRQAWVASQPAPDFSIACWVDRFPLFEPEVERIEKGYPVYNTTRLSATHHPFTMVSLDDYGLLATDPLACHGLHYDLVVDGVELGGGSVRIHDSELQRYVLSEVLKIADPDRLFGHLLNALATGCPPHAGLAIGLDRMVAMLCARKSVRDVIAFPKTMAGVDPVVGSPSKVTPAQLAPYHVKVI